MNDRGDTSEEAQSTPIAAGFYKSQGSSADKVDVSEGIDNRILPSVREGRRRQRSDRLNCQR
jgi:hypothetical protein